jgi:hypothetical protein
MSGNILSLIWFINGRLPVAETTHVVGTDVITVCTAWFNVQQFYVLPTQCIFVFCMDLRTGSDYFTLQLYLVGFCRRDLIL